MCIDMFSDLCIDMCIGICMGNCMDMCTDMSIDMCIDMGIDTHVDMCIDMCIDICTHPWLLWAEPDAPDVVVRLGGNPLGILGQRMLLRSLGRSLLDVEFVEGALLQSSVASDSTSGHQTPWDPMTPSGILVINPISLVINVSVIQADRVLTYQLL